MQISDGCGDPYRVYCAGPLFNEAERAEMTRIATELQRHGFRTFLPHADGMEFAKVQPVLAGWGYEMSLAGRLLHQAIFALDAYQVVEGCGSLVLNMNGRVPDEGAVAELTMAWMLGKPIVIYKEDVRSLISGRDNPLVVGQASFEVVRQIDRIGPALAAHLAERAAGDGHSATQRPPHLEAVVAQGRRLWQSIESLPLPRPEELIARRILELFVEHGRHPTDGSTAPLRYRWAAAGGVEVPSATSSPP